MEPRTIAYNDFVRGFRWNAGEHISIIGPTGSGKTTLAYHLLRNRKYVAIMATKPRDISLSSLAKNQKYETITRWPPRYNTNKVIVWPKFRPNDISNQTIAINDALLNIFNEGGWTVYIDETWYIDNILRLETLLKIYWTQARSMDISLMAGTQRPRDVPLLMYSQATHLFFFRFGDDSDIKRIGGIGAANSRIIGQIIPNLPKHSFLYVNAASGELIVSQSGRIITE